MIELRIKIVSDICRYCIHGVWEGLDHDIHKFIKPKFRISIGRHVEDEVEFTMGSIMEGMEGMEGHVNEFKK